LFPSHKGNGAVHPSVPGELHTLGIWVVSVTIYPLLSLSGSHILSSWEKMPKTLIVYESLHQGNTKKVALTMAKVLNADLMNVRKVNPDTFASYDLIGFGSGIYFRGHHQGVIALAEGLKPNGIKRAFIFSTAGFPCLMRLYHSALREVLRKKGITISGEFCCKGYDTYAIFKIIGGINRGRPNKKDLEDAGAFARGLL
jgi:flavodoxin